ncbi:MAG: hypothetical protein ABL857_03680 [Rickettsiales bacterium]
MSDSYNNAGNLGAHTSEQMAAQLAHTQEHSANMIANLSTVQEKNGKQYWLGMEISDPNVANTLSYITSIAPTAINDFLRGGVYEHVENAVTKLNAKHNFSTNPKIGQVAGFRAAAATSALLIGAQPMMGVAHSVSQRRKDRDAIKTALSAIVENNSAAYETNEVIKTAMERTSKNMVFGIKQAAAELPTVVLNGYYAVGGHKALKEKVELERTMNPHLDTSRYDNAKAGIEHRKKREAEINKLVKEHGEGSRAGIERDYDNHEQDLREAKIRANSNTDKKPENEVQSTIKTASLMGVGALNSMLKSNLARSESENNKPCAYELIMKLQEHVNNGDVAAGSNITDKIIEIFQQNEKDRSRAGIGAALLEKLEPLAERIGDVIARKELDAVSLVNMVGDGKVINKRRFIDSEKLEEILDGQRKFFGSRDKSPLDEFLADFQSPKLILSAIKKALAELQGDNKAVLASMLPEDVLLASGIKKKEISKLREKGHDKTYEVIKNNAVEFAKESPESLKNLGLSVDNVEAIKSYSELVLAGKDKEKETKSLFDSGGPVVGAVRDAILLKEQKSAVKGNNYWSGVINRKPPVVVAEKSQDISATERVVTGRENGAQAPRVV